MRKEIGEANSDAELERAGMSYLRSIDRMMDGIEAKKRIALRHFEEQIETDTGRIEDLTANRNREDTQLVKKAIEDAKQAIVDAKARLVAIEAGQHPIDVGLPNSLGYTAGSELYAFVIKNGRAYSFMSSEYENPRGPGEHQRDFLATLQRFQARELYSIPKTPGVCIPYGFLPDDGRTDFNTNVSIRYSDRPGVIYSINTGVVGVMDSRGPEPGLLKAATRAATGALAGVLTEGRVLDSIGPRSATIGALSANQGGTVLNAADAGQPPVPTYSVYTAYDGWMNSQVLPFIVVDMSSFTREQYETLPSNPPPFQESQQRLDKLLKSMRLRPTEPLMPELKDLR